MIKEKCADQRFGLGYKPKKDNYKRAAKIKMEVRMTKIEERELKEEELVILPPWITFLRSIEVIGSRLADLHIGTLECQDKEQIKGVKVEIEDEVLP